MKKIDKIEGGRVYPNQTNDLIDNVYELDTRLKKVEESGGGGTGGNSYIDFELKASSLYTEPFPTISASGMLRIQGGIFQVYMEVDFSNEAIFADASGFVMSIVDRNDYVKNLLLSQEEPMACAQGVSSFSYTDTSIESKEKSLLALILPGFYSLDELGIYFLTGEEFSEGSNIRGFTYIANGLIGPSKLAVEV